jgi:hypothetical protein
MNAATRQADYLTVLTALDGNLTKRWSLGADAKPVLTQYNAGTLFSYDRRPVASLDDLQQVLAGLKPTQAIVPGRLKEGVNPARATRRKVDRPGWAAPLEDRPSHLLEVDIENVPAVDGQGEFDPIADPDRALACVMAKNLPPELQGPEFVWQWTSSAGMKPGVRMRLWFWLDQAPTCEEKKAWLRPYLISKATPDNVIDGSLYSAEHLTYAAPPIFEGITDPVDKRIGIDGLFGCVAVPDRSTWVYKSQNEHEPRSAPEGVVEDDPATATWMSEEIARWLQNHGTPIEGDYSDQQAYDLACKLFDGDRPGFAPSFELVVDLLHMEWAPHFDRDWIEKKVESALSSRQNDVGCGPQRQTAPEILLGQMAAQIDRRAILKAFGERNGIDPSALDKAIQDAIVRAETMPADADDQDTAARRAKRFQTVQPSEAIKRRPPRFWDKDKLFLRAPGGSVTMIYAAYSNFKTTFTCGRLIAIAKEHDIRAVYVLCEGADGFGPLTLQAAVKDWNASHPVDQITTEWLDAHLLLIETPPKLTDAADMVALAEACREFAPDLVVIDTVGAAAAGQNLSAIEVGTMIGLNFRAFVRDLKTNGILIHHEGKDGERGPTGSQYFQNDVDGELRLIHDTGEEVLAVIVKKSRWGQKDRTVNFGTRAVSGLHVEGWTEPAEFVAVYELDANDAKRQVKVATAKAPPKTTTKDPQDGLLDPVYIEHRLRSDGVHEAKDGPDALTLAALLIGEQNELETEAGHQLRVAKLAKALKNKVDRDPRYRRLADIVEEGTPPHKVRRWFAPAAKASFTETGEPVY